MRLAWLALVLLVVALTGASSRAQQGQGQGRSGRARQLFEPRGDTVADGPDGRLDRTRKRGRRVRIGLGALQQAELRAALTSSR